MTSAPVLTRLNVNLTPRAVGALTMAATVEGLNRTEVVNRALRLYARLLQFQEEGNEILIRHKETGQGQLVTWI